MDILSKVRKPDDFELYNSLRLSITNIRGFRSNFVVCESLLESNSLDIFSLCQTNIENPFHFSNFTMKCYLSLIHKDSVTHLFHHRDWLTYCGKINRPDGLSYNFPISNNLQSFTKYLRLTHLTNLSFHVK